MENKAIFFKKEYQPKKIDDLSFNKDVSDKIIRSIPNNIILLGPKGSGKLARVYVAINEMNNYDNKVFKIKYLEQEIEIETESKKKKITFQYGESYYHLELSPTGFSSEDRKLFLNFVKEKIEVPRYYTQDQHIVVVKNCNMLNMSVYQALRVLLEKYSKHAKFIFLANTLAGIPDPIISRCVIVKNKGATNKDAIEMINNISTLSGLKVTKPAIKNIINNSSLITGQIDLNNLFYVLHMSYPNFEKYSSFKPEIFKQIEGLNKYINLSSSKINQKAITDIRNLIYEIMLSQIDLTLIYHYILDNLCESVLYSDEQKMDMVNLIAELESKSIKGNKTPIHLEALVFSMNRLVNSFTIKSK